MGAKPFPGLSPRQGRQNSTCSALAALFRKFRSFSASCPDTSLKRDFSKTNRWTQRSHSWIDLDFLERRKLLRSQTNSQILRNLHFCDPFTPIFDSPVERNCPCRCITLGLRKALRVMHYALHLGAKPFPGLSPRQGRQNSTCSLLAALFQQFRPFPASCPRPILPYNFF